MSRLRLLRVTVAPVFVIDDGEQLQEVAAEPVVVPATDWADFMQKRWPELVASYEEQVGIDGDAPLTEPGA